MDPETLVLALDAIALAVRSGGYTREEGLDAVKRLADAPDADFARHSPGDVWQGPHGHWVTMRQDGHVVPAKAPGGQADVPAARPAAAGDRPSAGSAFTGMVLGEGGPRFFAGGAELDEAAYLKARGIRMAPADDDPARGRPSLPEERHPDSTPEPLPWRAPPPKKPRVGEFKRPVGEESQTGIGDLGEALALYLGFRSILPPGQRSHKAGENEEKGSTIDLEFDHSGKAYELKLCNDTSTEFRLKSKAKEKAQKLQYAELNGLTPCTMVAVRETGTGVVHFYAAREPGLIGAEVSQKKYDYVGSVDASVLGPS